MNKALVGMWHKLYIMRCMILGLGQRFKPLLQYKAQNKL